MRKSIDEKNLMVTGRTGDGFAVTDDVLVVVTQAFGPKGDNLVGISDVTFDGYPAVTLLLKVGDREGLVHLSPIHGDARKAGFTDIPIGTHCTLLCPISKLPLDRLGEVAPGSDATYFALYLTARLEKGSMVAVSDTWGHYHSRLVDDFELVSYWASMSGEG